MPSTIRNLLAENAPFVQEVDVIQVSAQNYTSEHWGLLWITSRAISFVELLSLCIISGALDYILVFEEVICVRCTLYVARCMYSFVFDVLSWPAAVQPVSGSNQHACLILVGVWIRSSCVHDRE